MKLFNFLRGKDNKFSQSGQDQFAYNISGSNGTYLEIGAHDPVINSNTFNLEVKCEWKGISIEYDKSFKKSLKNKIQSLGKKNFAHPTEFKDSDQQIYPKSRL